MANSSIIDNEINGYEDFTNKVRYLEKYLAHLDSEELQRSCMFLESTLKPIFEKNKETYDKLSATKASSIQESNTESHLNIDSPHHITNFDNESTFTEKFLNSVQDDNFLPDTILIQNNILEEKSNVNKDNCFEKLSPNSSTVIKLSQSNALISEDNLKYNISFKDDNSLNTYLDLSHKSTLQQNKIENSDFSSPSQNKNLEDNSEIILNLCSKNRTLDLKDNNDVKNESSNIVEEFDNISYINTSNILLEERLLVKNEIDGTNPDMNKFTSRDMSTPEGNENCVMKSQTSFRDDITKMFTPHLSSNISVIHCTNSLKDEKREFSSHNEYSPYMSEVEASISLTNETSKSCFRNENHESLISIDCDSNGILNLKKEPICDEREIYAKNTSSQDSNSLNLGFYAIFNSLESVNKNLKDANVAKTENIKALNLVNKKNKTQNILDNAIQNIDFGIEKKNCFKENELNFGLSMEDKRENNVLSAFKDIKTGPVSCWKCQNEFTDLTSFSGHNYMGSCGNSLYCTHCDINFKSKTIFKKHLLCHKRNTCSKCSSTFRRRQLLRTHMKTEHGINLVSKMYNCEHCPRVFMKRSSIYYHLQKHALPNQKVCPKCGKFLEGESEYTEHMNEHIKNAFFQCNICSYIFERFQQYNDHMEGHKKHVCAYCEANLISFSSKKMLFKHYKTEHPDLPQKVVLNKKYSCDQCPKVFNRPSLLQDHKRTHNDMPRYECRSCNKKYALRSSLRKHLKAVHSQNEKRANVCHHCNINFPSVNLLDKHSSTVHNAIINYSCTYCDFKTRHRKVWKKHTDSHLEKKKYLCDICGSMFQCSTTLKHHTLFLHSDERKFKCKECDKSFKNRSCLSRHLRTHSSERPYKCECGSCFKQSYHLVRHLSTAHNKKPSSKKSKIKVRENDETEMSFFPNITMATSNDTSIVPEVERSTSDILLTAGNTVLMSESSINQESSPIFTVLDSQLIQLIPSTLQLHQEGIHTVSLVNGEIHTLSIAPSTYEINEEAFNATSSSDAIIIHSSQPGTVESLALQNMQAENVSNISEDKIHDPEAMETDQKTGSSQITIEGDHGIQFTSGSLSDLQYRENVDENEAIPSLSSAHYLTHHQEATLNHDISTNISIF